MGKKVLVRSRYREVTVRTQRELSRDDKGKIVESSTGFRQFINHHAWMTMQEAAELIDSPENKKHIDGGLPPLYYYPAGMPVPVDENFEGPLAPALTGEGLVANNPSQNEAARLLGEQADEQIAARARKQGKVAAKAEPAPSKISDDRPAKIENPDAPGGADALGDVPTFRDEKAAAARR